MSDGRRNGLSAERLPLGLWLRSVRAASEDARDARVFRSLRELYRPTHFDEQSLEDSMATLMRYVQVRDCPSYAMPMLQFIPEPKRLDNGAAKGYTRSYLCSTYRVQ